MLIVLRVNETQNVRMRDAPRFGAFSWGQSLCMHQRPDRAVRNQNLSRSKPFQDVLQEPLLSSPFFQRQP
jgi:hypothetical protein